MAEAMEHYKVAAGQDIAEAQCCLASIFKRKSNPWDADGAGRAGAAHKGTEIP